MIDRLRGRELPIVCVCALVYAAVLSWLSLAKYRAFASGWDHAIYSQYVWLLGHAKDPFSTLDARFMLGDHVQPGLVLLAPLGAIGHVSAGLLVLQALALAVVAPLLYVLGRRLTVPPGLALVVPILWLVSPAVVRPNLDDFHPETIAAAFVVGSAIMAVAGRWRWFVVLAIVACSLREDVALVYVGGGIVLAHYRSRRAGVVLASAAASWYLVAGLVILPAFGTAVKNDYALLFAGSRGTTLGDVLRHVATHPLTTVAEMFDPNDLGVLLTLVLTTAGLCVLAPWWLLLPAPSLLLNFLSYNGDQHHLGHQYYVITVTGFAIAGVAGAKRLDRLAAARPPALRFAAGVGVLLTVLSLGALRTARVTVANSRADRSSREAAVAAIPARAAVAAPRNYAPHLAQRVDVYPTPEPFERVFRGARWDAADRRGRVSTLQYVIVDSTTPPPVLWGHNSSDVRSRATAAGFKPVLTRGPVTVYRRE